MNVKDAFDFNKANFSGIAELEPNEHLAISKLVHQAILEVNEEGSEAAAATGVVIAFKMGAAMTPIKIFKCNRPFIFIIHEKKHNNFLFIGKYLTPL